MKISESKIIEKFLKPLAFNNKNSLKFLDDIYFDAKRKIIFSTDTYIQDVHFLNSSNPDKFVKKIFRSAISDILCKGGEPITYFLSLGMYKVNYNWLNKFKKNLMNESKKFGVFLGGGDTVNSKKLNISISVIGKVKKKPIFRNGAKKNDDIYITGNLGDSYLGLLANLKKKNFYEFNKYFKKIYSQPDIPIKFSKKISNFANSSMDISDGLFKDLKSLCKSSKCGAKIFYEKIPISKIAKKVCLNNKIKLANIFSKGDDYQILFTSNKKHRKLIENTARRTNTKVSRVGKITARKIVKLYKSDKIFNLSDIKLGYMHRF